MMNCETFENHNSVKIKNTMPRLHGNKADWYMVEAITNILDNGYMDENPRPVYEDGTPAHTLSVDQVVRKFDIGKGEFPITSLRPIVWKSGIKEIFWIYQDQSNDLNMLRDKYNIKYWNQWESKDIPNTIGARYGEVVRRYNLMNNLLEGLKNDPYGRRHIIDLYQFRELNETDGLHPCAFLTIWKVSKGRDGKEYLNLTLIQRSGDALPASCCGINEIQYTALMMMVARHCGYELGTFMHVINNEQLYDRHFDEAKEMVRRYNECEIKSKPKLILNPEKTNFYEFTIDDFTMENYNPIYPQLPLELGI